MKHKGWCLQKMQSLVLILVKSNAFVGFELDLIFFCNLCLSCFKLGSKNLPKIDPWSKSTLYIWLFQQTTEVSIWNDLFEILLHYYFHYMAIGKKWSLKQWYIIDMDTIPFKEVRLRYSACVKYLKHMFWRLWSRSNLEMSRLYRDTTRNEARASWRPAHFDFPIKISQWAAKMWFSRGYK